MHRLLGPLDDSGLLARARIEPLRTRVPRAGVYRPDQRRFLRSVRIRSGGAPLARSRGLLDGPSILRGMVDVAVRLPSPLVEIRDERVESRGLRLYLKRDDLIHAELPGNKWRKLKYNIAAAQE